MVHFNRLSLSLLVLLSIALGYAEGQCVMYGKCGQDPSGRDLNCADNGPPRPLDLESLSVLTTWCPELVAESDSNFCCDADQLVDLTGNLNLPSGLMGRCPSCFFNFRQMFCHLACSPNQAQFLIVNETLQNEQGQDMVYKLDAIVDESYADGTFESCKDVKWGPDNDNYALDVLCGPWGHAECTGERWFDYMGSTSNGFAPFDIRYQYSPPGQEFGFHQQTFKCQEIPTNANSTCTCTDCLDACLI